MNFNWQSAKLIKDTFDWGSAQKKEEEEATASPSFDWGTAQRNDDMGIRADKVKTQATEPSQQPQAVAEEQPINIRQHVVADVYSRLVEFEGEEGDTTGAAPTGKVGVTAGARRAVGKEGMSDHEIAKAYVEHLYDKMPESMKQAPDFVQAVFVDSAYNLGEGMFNYKGLNAKAEKGDWLGAVTHLLETASIGGAASRGIARRRAVHYNEVAEKLGQPTIKAIHQKADGTLAYLDDRNNIIHSYRPRNGRHNTSGIGIINV